MKSNVRRVQRSPKGWEVFYGLLNRKRRDGYLLYQTACTCGSKEPFNGRTAAPHRLKLWAEAHADHRPEYKALLPLPHEEYPNELNTYQRQGHPGYKAYKDRIQALGFYTTVHMLESAGFCLPEEQQRKWDELRITSVKRSVKGRAAASVMQASVSETDSESALQSGAAEGSVEAALHGIKAEGIVSGGQSSISSDGDSDAPTGPGAGLRTVQVAPSGWYVHYGLLDYKENHGYLAYRTECTCRNRNGKPVTGWVETPQKIMRWAELHGDHRPEYGVLKPLPNEQYPDGLALRQRWAHPAYKRYRLRMQSLGFYTCVNMLEEAGFCLPEAQQKKFDELRKGKGEAVEPSRGPSRVRQRRKRGQQASVADDSSDGEQSWEAGATDGSVYSESPGCQRRAIKRRKAAPARAQVAAAPRVKAEPVGRPEQPDTPVQADKYRRKRQPSPSPRIVVKGEEAGPSAPEQDAPAGPSGSPHAAAQSTPIAARVKEEVVDLTADSPRASSYIQLPFTSNTLQITPAAPGHTNPGHEAPAAGIMQTDSSSAEATQVLPATSASPPPAPVASNGPLTPRNGVCTLGDVIVDVTRLKAVEAQIAAAGVQLDFDRILQCLHSALIRQALAEQQDARISELQARADTLQKEHEAVLADMKSRAEKSERLLTCKDAEIRSLRDQVDVLKA